MILYPYQITVWLWFVIKIRPCQARPHNIIVYTLLTNIQITATVLKLQPAFQGTKPLYRSSLIKLSHSNFHEQRWLAVFRFCILLFILKKIVACTSMQLKQSTGESSSEGKKVIFSFQKKCHLLICKRTKTFLFPRHSFSYTCSRESSSGATFFWAFLKRNRRKGKNKSLFWQYSSWGQGKLQSSSQFATLPCSSLVPHGLYGTFMPRRNTGYASLGGKLNLMFIFSLFLFIFSFFAYVCVANPFSANVHFFWKDQPKLI